MSTKAPSRKEDQDFYGRNRTLPHFLCPSMGLRLTMQDQNTLVNTLTKGPHLLAAPRAAMREYRLHSKALREPGRFAAASDSRMHKDKKFSLQSQAIFKRLCYSSCLMNFGRKYGSVKTAALSVRPKVPSGRRWLRLCLRRINGFALKAWSQAPPHIWEQQGAKPDAAGNGKGGVRISA